MRNFPLEPIFATNYLEDGFLPYTFGHVLCIGTFCSKINGFREKCDLLVNFFKKNEKNLSKIRFWHFHGKLTIKSIKIAYKC